MIRNSQELQTDLDSASSLPAQPLPCLLPCTRHSPPKRAALPPSRRLYPSTTTGPRTMRLSDNIPLTEKRDCASSTSCSASSVPASAFDYYMMDAFGLHRTEHIAIGASLIGQTARMPGSRSAGQWVLPGLWFSTNTLVKIQAAPAWKKPINANAAACRSLKVDFYPIL